MTDKIITTIYAKEIDQLNNKLSSMKDKDIDNSQSVDSLILAAARNDYKSAINIVSNLDNDSEYKNVALMLAAEKSHYDIVYLLLDSGAHVNAKYKNVALMLAAENGHVFTVALLLDRGADVNAKDDDGNTPLMFAAKNGHCLTVGLLIKLGADINAKDNFGRTALMMAAEKGHYDIVEFLLQYGADINAKDNFGRTALMMAAENAHDSTVALLLDSGADVNAKDNDGMTALGYVQNLIERAQGDPGYIQRLEEIERLLIAAESKNRFTWSQLLGGLAVVAVGTAIVFLFAVDMVLPGFSLGIQLCAVAGFLMITGPALATGYHSLFGNTDMRIEDKGPTLESCNLGERNSSIGSSLTDSNDCYDMRSRSSSISSDDSDCWGYPLDI